MRLFESLFADDHSNPIVALDERTEVEFAQLFG